MLFSVIIPVYNSGKSIRRCVGSVMEQNCNDLEIILVDDGSMDDSGRICDEMSAEDQRIISIHQANNGPGSARNAGIKAAQGDYLLFLDSDDIYLKGSFERIADLIRENNPDVVIGCFRAISKRGTLLFERDCDLGSGAIEQTVIRRAIRAKRIAPNVWRYVVKRNMVMQKELYFEEGLFLAEDVLWTVQMLCTAQSFCVDSKPFYQYCMTAGSITAEIDFRKLQDIMYVSERLFDFAQGKEKEKKFLVYNYICIILNSMLQEYNKLNSKEQDEIRVWTQKQRRMLDESLKAQPFIKAASGIMGNLKAMLFFARAVQIKGKFAGIKIE